MNDFDLERLGEVWREEPSPAEMQRLQRAAVKVSRRARWAQRIEVGAAILVAALVLTLVLTNPSVDTALAGGGALLVLLLTQRRQRRLRAVELASLTGGSEDMIDQLVARTEASMKRNLFGIIAIGPATLVGFLFSYVAENRAARQLFPDDLPGIWFERLVIFFVIAMIAYLLYSLRQARIELKRLGALRELYRREQESSES